MTKFNFNVRSILILLCLFSGGANAGRPGESEGGPGNGAIAAPKADAKTVLNLSSFASNKNGNGYGISLNLKDGRYGRTPGRASILSGLNFSYYSGKNSSDFRARARAAFDVGEPGPAPLPVGLNITLYRTQFLNLTGGGLSAAIALTEDGSTDDRFIVDLNPLMWGRSKDLIHSPDISAADAENPAIHYSPSINLAFEKTLGEGFQLELSALLGIITQDEESDIHLNYNGSGTSVRSSGDYSSLRAALSKVFGKEKNILITAEVVSDAVSAKTSTDTYDRNLNNVSAPVNSASNKVKATKGVLSVGYVF